MKYLHLAACRGSVQMTLRCSRFFIIFLPSSGFSHPGDKQSVFFTFSRPVSDCGSIKVRQLTGNAVSSSHTGLESPMAPALELFCIIEFVVFSCPCARLALHVPSQHYLLSACVLRNHLLLYQAADSLMTR